MKKLNSIADLKAAVKEYKPILDLRENHTDAIPDKRDILVCGGTGCTSSESLLIIEKLKEEIKKYLEEKEIEYIDCGTFDEESVDYPEIAKAIALEVQGKECDKGIAICRSGIGMSIVANKFKGIRWAKCNDEEEAKYSRMHNDANILALGADYIETSEAIRIVRMWIATEFEGGRHEERIKLINEIEKENMKEWRPNVNVGKYSNSIFISIYSIIYGNTIYYKNS